MTKLFSVLGGRKYFFALTFFILVTVGLVFKWIGDDSWLNALEWCLAVYLGSNILMQVPSAFTKEPVEDSGDSPFFAWFGGRKMFLALLFLVAITAAFFTKYITTADKYINGLEWLLGIYLGGNAADSVPKAFSNAGRQDVCPEPEPEKPSSAPQV